MTLPPYPTSHHSRAIGSAAAMPTEYPNPPLVQRLMRHDAADQPLPTNLVQQRGNFVAVNAGFDQPRRTHPRLSPPPIDNPAVGSRGRGAEARRTSVAWPVRDS